MKLADRLLKAWYEGHPALIMLRPLEQLYRYFAQKKRARFLAQNNLKHFAVPVIVVGNITVGGTGKTPMILWLIEHCRSRGLNVGVVSRGYGAKPEHFPWQVSHNDSAQVAGDEPLLIVQRTGVPLVIDPERSRAIEYLLSQHQVDLILSDDGLQHYRMPRDLELVLIDAARGLGNGRCLPEGPLREPKERLQSVDAVLYNGALNPPEGFGFSLIPSQLVHLATGAVASADHLTGQTVHAVAGIGNPERFFKTLETLNLTPIRHAFADHARYSAELLSFSPEHAVVMTEKDAVKCQRFAGTNWWYLAVEAKPCEAFILWLDHQLDLLLSSKAAPRVQP